MKYTIIVEKGETSYGAYVADLPGCVAVADTCEEVMELIKAAVDFHLEGLREDGDPISEPSSEADIVEVETV